MSERDPHGSAVENYLEQLARELGAGREFTPRFVTEARDHLLCAVDFHLQAGFARKQAEAAAIEGFGSVEEIAGAVVESAREESADIHQLASHSKGEGSMIEMEVLGVMIVNDPTGSRDIQNLTESDREQILKAALDAWKAARATGKETDAVVFEESAPGLPVVVLREKNGDRLLAIFIGAVEATAISFALQQVKTSRPMTHDFIVGVLRSLEGVEASRVVITGLAKGTYFARLEVEQSGRSVEIDARPSDAIAVAVRLGLPVFVNEEDEGLADALIAA